MALLQTICRLFEIAGRDAVVVGKLVKNMCGTNLSLTRTLVFWTPESKDAVKIPEKWYGSLEPSIHLFLSSSSPASFYQNPSLYTHTSDVLQHLTYHRQNCTTVQSVKHIQAVCATETRRITSQAGILPRSNHSIRMTFGSSVRPQTSRNV